MSEKRDLLIEIGTEEMPPSTLKRLGSAFADEMARLFQESQLTFNECRWLATPRRLSLIVNQLDSAQADVTQEKRGPAVDVAFDENGKPTKATEGFARSCGVAIDQLGTVENEKGKWLAYTSQIKGKQTAELLAEMVETAMARLPIAKRMRWGDSDIEFVRPVKWLLFLFDDEVLHSNVIGIDSGDVSYGHRFHHPHAIKINAVSSYIQQLKETGKVIVDFEERKTIIKEQLGQLAKENHGQAIIDEDLLDEVTALVEWPVGFTGEFDPVFLELPEEVLIATMQDHQKYFPVIDSNSRLMACFIAFANIESEQPELIKQGNERVIQPRLSDARFFWERDLKFGLANHADGLKHVIYQKQLGSLHDRKERLLHTVSYLANRVDADENNSKRSAELCFCDLLTEMVYEFPELQGTMGKHYAAAAGENEEVAQALEDFYRPRFAGDTLPVNRIGQCLAISEKTDSLLGIFAIGKAPTGAKDPFALRRAAIGLMRIIIESGLDIDLRELLAHAAVSFPDAIDAKAVIDDVMMFLMERLRRYYLDEGIDVNTFESVLATHTSKPLDFHHRIKAVAEFRKLPEAESLAAANKRIANILRKDNGQRSDEIAMDLLTENAEIKLANELSSYRERLAPLIEKQDYQQTLTELAGLRDTVDAFFDDVMVMCEDEKLKQNRLTLLDNLHKLFLETADISKLQG